MEVIAGARLAFRSETVPTPLPHRNSDLKQRAHMFAIIRYSNYIESDRRNITCKSTQGLHLECKVRSSCMEIERKS